MHLFKKVGPPLGQLVDIAQSPDMQILSGAMYRILKLALWKKLTPDCPLFKHLGELMPPKMD